MVSPKCIDNRLLIFLLFFYKATDIKCGSGNPKVDDPSLSSTHHEAVYCKFSGQAPELRLYSVLLAWLLDGQLLLRAFHHDLVHVGSSEPCHALGFSLAHPVFLEDSLRLL